PLVIIQVRERQPDIALALVRSVVHRDKQPRATRGLPRKGHEAIPGPVAVPGGNTFEQVPLAVLHDWLTQHGEQPIVKPFQLGVTWFVRSSAKMRGNAYPAPLELTLVEET